MGHVLCVNAFSAFVLNFVNIMLHQRRIAVVNSKVKRCLVLAFNILGKCYAKIPVLISPDSWGSRVVQYLYLCH